MPSRPSAFLIALAGCDCSVESGPATTPCAPISTSQVSPSSTALSLFITTTAAAPSEICDAEPAVMVPSLRNAGLRPASDSAVVLARMPSSSVNCSGSPLRCGMLHRHDLVGEDAVLPRRGGLLVRARRELVLLQPGELVDVVALLGERAHRLVGEHVVQAVVGHVVEHRDVAVLVAGPAVHQQVRRLGHRLLAAGHHHVELAGPNQLVSQRDGVDAGQAHLVDGQRRHVPADAGRRRRPAGPASGRRRRSAPGP